MLARVNFPEELFPDFGVGLEKKLQALRTVMACEDNWKLRLLNEMEIISLQILQLDCGTHFDKRCFCVQA